ncbi:MAG: TrmH family RNA methyltransferase [Acidimicrobiales bacterium]|jgi:tRNA (guanosine-2'-O-)-methyltransferase
MTRELSPTALKRLHRSWRRRTTDRVALALDGVQNPFNVGAIVRSAAAYGVEQLWLTAGSTPPDHPKVHKTALGSQRYLRWTSVADGAAAVQAARDDGYLVVGLELAEGASPIQELALDVDVCFAIGHEDRGLSRATLEACDQLAYLPLVGRIASLNVATATAIALYEARRQQWADPGSDTGLG